MQQVNWLDEREARAWRGLQEMAMRLDGELARRLAAESDLSHTDYAVLVALTDQVDGRVRLYELGELLGWEKSRLSHHLKRMERRGLVAKQPCDDDRRGAYVVVTPAGRREIEAAAPSHVDDVRELFLDHLAPDQLEVVADVAEKVLAALRASPPPAS